MGTTGSRKIRRKTLTADDGHGNRVPVVVQTTTWPDDELGQQWATEVDGGRLDAQTWFYPNRIAAARGHKLVLELIRRADEIVRRATSDEPSLAAKMMAGRDVAWRRRQHPNWPEGAVLREARDYHAWLCTIVLRLGHDADARQYAEAWSVLDAKLQVELERGGKRSRGDRR